MPKEVIYGGMYTVRRGDLPIMQSRTRTHLEELLVDYRDQQTRTPATPPELDPDAELSIQSTLEVRWGRDTDGVGLYIAGHDHNEGLPVDVGGWWIYLDWRQTNGLIKKLRPARDQTWGVPE